MSPNTILVQLNEGGESTVEAKNVIIATGLEFTPFPGGAIEIGEEQVISSTGALSLQSVPGKIIVPGGGIIGLETGSVWGRLGLEVTVVEFLDGIGVLVSMKKSRASPSSFNFLCSRLYKYIDAHSTQKQFQNR